MNLEKFRKAYYDEGKPLISDEVYDSLADFYGEDEGLGGTGDIKHLYRMYSQQKIYDAEPMPTACVGEELIKSPKLDGSAISLLYVDGFLVQGLTRGDGVRGKNIGDKVVLMNSIPKIIDMPGLAQISGEVVTSKEAKNARNTAAGAFGLKDLDEFVQRELYFVAYSFLSNIVGNPTYENDMDFLQKQGFVTILDIDFDQYKTDGTIYRINDNKTFYDLGFTSKHPRGSYAHKLKSDVESKESVLLEVIWQTGASGKVTPVGIIDEVVIDDANINRMTLHNVGYVEQLDLDIGDEILVTRSGGVIPKILGNISKDIYL